MQLDTTHVLHVTLRVWSCQWPRAPEISYEVKKRKEWSPPGKKWSFPKTRKRTWKKKKSHIYTVGNEWHKNQINKGSTLDLTKEIKPVKLPLFIPYLNSASSTDIFQPELDSSKQLRVDHRDSLATSAAMVMFLKWQQCAPFSCTKAYPN